MTYLLELRERVRTFLKEYENILLSALRFLLAFASFLTVTSQISYLKPVQMPILALALAVFCIFLPSYVLSLLLGALIVYHSFGISFEAGFVALSALLLLLLMYYVFKPKYSILIALSFLACTYNIGGAVPIAAALLCSPVSLIPVCIGVIFYDIVTQERANYSMLVPYNDRLSSIEKVSAFLQDIVTNRRSLMLGAAFVITFLVVWSLRRRAVSYAWNIAIPVGVMVYILVIMAGSFLFDIPLSLVGMIVGCVLGVACSLVEELFFFTLDGSKTEYLEYEDENYYYFVKAVPKMNIAAQNRLVRRITASAGNDAQEDADVGEGQDKKPDTVFWPDPQQEDRAEENEKGGQDESY